MPHMLITVPEGAFPRQQRHLLVRALNAAAARAERIPDDPGKRFLCWIVIEEVAAGLWTCGGVDVDSQVLPCIAMIHLPAGVLDDVSRQRYVALVHNAFRQAMAAGDRRPLATSVVLHDVVDGTWGANGHVMRLADFARVAGFEHLQDRVGAR